MMGGTIRTDAGKSATYCYLPLALALNLFIDFFFHSINCGKESIFFVLSNTSGMIVFK